MSRIWALILILLVAAAAGCSKEEQAQEQSETTATNQATGRGSSSEFGRVSGQRITSATAYKGFYFECDDYWIVALFETRDVLLETPDGTFRLSPEQVASGAKYSSDTAILWIKGEEARFEFEGRVYEKCLNNPARAIWEDARIRGVNYRAVGNEPGWTLEIAAQKTLFVTNYGEDRFVFPTPVPEIEPGESATYEAVYKGVTLKVVIRHEDCADTMADDHYGTSVEVTIDNTTYRGCGKILTN